MFELSKDNVAAKRAHKHEQECHIPVPRVIFSVEGVSNNKECRQEEENPPNIETDCKRRLFE